MTEEWTADIGTIKTNFTSETILQDLKEMLSQLITNDG
jgi:hypothetical protein